MAGRARLRLYSPVNYYDNQLHLEDQPDSDSNYVLQVCVSAVGGASSSIPRHVTQSVEGANVVERRLRYRAGATKTYVGGQVYAHDHEPGKPASFRLRQHTLPAQQPPTHPQTTTPPPPTTQQPTRHPPTPPTHPTHPNTPPPPPHPPPPPPPPPPPQPTHPHPHTTTPPQQRDRSARAEVVALLNDTTVQEPASRCRQRRQ